DHRHVVEVLEARGTDEGAALREADDVLDLAAPEVRPDLVGYRSHPLAGEEDVAELRPVGELDRHHIPCADARRLEASGHAVDPLAQLGVRDPSTAIDEDHPVRLRLRLPGQDLVEGLGLPVAGPGPALGESRDEPGLERHRANTGSTSSVKRRSEWARERSPQAKHQMTSPPSVEKPAAPAACSPSSRSA